MPEPGPKIARYEKLDPADPASLAETARFSSTQPMETYGSGLLSWFEQNNPMPAMIEGEISATVGGILDLARSRYAPDRTLAESYIAEPLQHITLNADEQALLNHFKSTETGIEPAQARVQAVMDWFATLKKNRARRAGPEVISIMKKLAEYRREKWQSNLENGKKLFAECRQDLVAHLGEFGAKHNLQFSPRASARLERTQLVLRDPIYMRLREVLGGYRAELGLITMRLNDVDRPDAFKVTTRHELFHAASGHLLMRDRQFSTQSDNDPETMDYLKSLDQSDEAMSKIYNLIMQEVADLSADDLNITAGENEEFGQPIDITKYTRVGVHFIEIGRERFRWLGEAMTEHLTRLYQTDKHEPMETEGYDAEEELFALLLHSGRQAIPESVALNAYLEDYDPAKTGQRLPAWHAFARQIASAYTAGGFLPRLDNMVQSYSVAEAIKYMKAKNFTAIMQARYID